MAIHEYSVNNPCTINKLPINLQRLAMQGIPGTPPLRFWVKDNQWEVLHLPCKVFMQAPPFSGIIFVQLFRMQWRLSTFMRQTNPSFKFLVLLFFLLGLFFWQVMFSVANTVDSKGVTATGRQPFAPGERLTFQLRWGVIPAGETTLEVYPMEEVSGEQAYHFVMTTRTNSFVDLFYKVRDRIDAYTDAAMTHSVFYKKNQQEGSTKRKVEVRFDWQRQEAFYSNFGLENKSVPLMPGTFDPLSIFYYIRLLDLQEPGLVERPVTDGKKNLIGRARIVKRENVRVAENDYDTYLLEPDLEHIGGVFEKSKDATIRLWVSADERRLPVKIKSKVAVGSFVAELSGVENIDNL